MSKESNAAGRPVQIISLVDEGKYRFEKQAFQDIIHDAGVENKKICVVAIAGPFRKGKSFMSNLFVECLEKSDKGAQPGVWCNKDLRLDKFHWRAGTKPDTTGIYMWSRPFIRKDKNDEEVAVFLMDTQGTFDTKSTVKQCATIFALSTMLSSTNIFNVTANIQEDDLQNLALFTEYAKLARANCREKPFQRQVFLVRDWGNSDEFEFGSKGGSDFLKSIMKIYPEQAREQRDLRMNLESSFQQMECYLMPHPGLKIATNNKNRTLGDAEEAFLINAPKFVEETFCKAHLEAKIIGGRQLTCIQYAEFFERYTNIFNSDEIPKPMSILQATVEIADQQNFDDCKSYYDKHLEAAIVTQKASVAKLTWIHMDIKRKTMEMFEKNKQFGGNLSSGKQKTKLEEHITCVFENMKQRVAEIENANSRAEEQKLQLERLKTQNQMEERRMELETQRQKVEIDLLKTRLNERKKSEKNDTVTQVLQTVQEVARVAVPLIETVVFLSKP